ncbi:MAG: GNAT family N-acetyltransferase [Alphaproteobacteria bacterium]|nr:GNAT family N-acetyltransferase [Alphaproteobacteria bacterium]
MRIREAVAVSDIADMRALFIEYQRWLGQDLTFQNFSAELASLPGDYAPPLGRMLLARHVDGTPVAGVAMKPLSAGTCEMKRLFVRRPWRGLAEAIVDAGRSAGYGRMRLDTFSKLSAATELYRSLGFREIAPYYENPLDGVIYMEKALDPSGAC